MLIFRAWATCELTEKCAQYVTIQYPNSTKHLLTTVYSIKQGCCGGEFPFKKDYKLVACEQALCLGKNSEEREGKRGERACSLFAFPSPDPARLKACSQANKLEVARSFRFTTAIANNNLPGFIFNVFAKLLPN